MVRNPAAFGGLQSRGLSQEELEMLNMSTEEEGIPQGMTLEQVRVAFLRLLEEETNNHYRMGLLYNYVVDKRLAEQAKYKDALDYFSKNIQQIARTTLVTYGAVARNFSAEVCTEHGVTRLSLLLAYENATDSQADHAEPGGTFIQVPGDNGGIQHKLFADCSVEDMRQALQLKRKPSSAEPIPAEQMAVVEQYQKSITGRFAKGTPVKVTARRHKGQVYISFKDIPLAQVGKLTEVLVDGFTSPVETPK